jgi:predicted RNA-binding protein with TRAM domain
MATVPDNLKAVFTTSVSRDGGFYIGIPLGFVESGTVELGQQYKVALIETPETEGEPVQDSGPDRSTHTERQPQQQPSRSGPPVEEGEEIKVQIESLGDGGDGVAKVNGGYVVIVPGTEPGQQPMVRVNKVKSNVAFATVVRD